MPQHPESVRNGDFVESHSDHEIGPPELQVPPYFARKHVFMRCLGGALLAGFAPLILLSMLLVRLTSSGPALFRQTRLGKDGKRFEVLKIRTMYCDAEDVSGPMLCQPGDSRVTPIGRLLRFLHLDELPQLVNVARGEMCLVGPRPERPEIIAKNKLRERVPGFDARTKVLPGVTGLAQINLPADLTAACVIPKVKLDLEYIHTASANLDARILVCTALRMLGVRHGHAVRFLGLGRHMQLDQALTPIDSPVTSKRPFVALFRPKGASSSQLVHSSLSGGVRAPATYASTWDDLGNESGEAAAVKEEAEIASLRSRPR